MIGRVAEKLPDSAGKIAIVDAEPTGDGPDDHADPARGRQLDVACRARCRGTRNLAGPRASQDRAPRARDRRARRRAPDVGRAPRRRRLLVDHLAKDDSAKPAARDAWSILTQILVDRAWVWIVLGVVTLVGVWFVGDTRRAGQARRAAQPVLENRWATYAIAAGAVLVLALIAPLFTRGWPRARPARPRHRRRRGGPGRRPRGSGLLALGAAVVQLCSRTPSSSRPLPPGLRPSPSCSIRSTASDRVVASSLP